MIRENPDDVKNKLDLRNEDPAVIEKIFELDKSRLELIHKTETLKEERNKATDEIALMKRNKDPRPFTVQFISEMKKVSENIKTLDEELKKYDADIDNLMRYIPNLPHDNVPHGKSEKDNVEIKVSGEKKSFDFEVKDHVQLGKDHDILDFERGTKISGSGFALYKEVMTPVLVTRESMEAAEKVPKFEDDMYYMEKDDMFAIPTAEVSILNIHRDEILKSEDLPIKYCGFTNCFRREAGSYGKDTKGFLRVHQFNKVELITFCKPEDSYDEVEKMLSHATGILDKLGLHYRIIELCTADIGFAATKCYDIEVWSYAEDKWLETSSVSNCTDFQSRRAQVRYKKMLENNKTKTEFVHILNGSGLATSRLMVALLEANQTKEGNIEIPEVLKEYTGFDII